MMLLLLLSSGFQVMSHALFVLQKLWIKMKLFFFIMLVNPKEWKDLPFSIQHTDEDLFQKVFKKTHVLACLPLPTGTLLSNCN